MKLILLLIGISQVIVGYGQSFDSLNTAAKCQYMKAEEREMIYEINRVRSNPRSYLLYIEPMLATARENLEKNGKGHKSYSLTYVGSYTDGKESRRVDTTWYYRNVEEVRALTTLIKDLKKIKGLSILQPDSGIYNAALKHAVDQQEHDWQLMHTGSDGSSPWERIIRFSPTMSFGNENIAGNSGNATPRNIVIQLLVDEGIPGYGHRYNLLNAQWTHVACVWDYYQKQMHWWIQDFAFKKKQ